MNTVNNEKKITHQKPSTKPVAAEHTKEKTNVVREYEYDRGKLPHELTLPKRLAAQIPAADKIIISSFANAEEIFGKRKEWEMNNYRKKQDYIQYYRKPISGETSDERRKSIIEVFAYSFHPFLQQFTTEAIRCAKNMLWHESDLPSSYEVTDRELNVRIATGYHRTGYQETSEFIRYRDSCQESYHDGGGSCSKEWCIYAASITEIKIEPKKEIGNQTFSALPGFVNLPYCCGFWTEGEHVYVVNPWGLSGVFEYYCHAEEQRDWDSEEKIWNVGVPFEK